MTDTDASRLPALLRRLAAMERGDMRTKDGEGRENTVEWRANFAEQVASIFAAMSDGDVLAAYQRTDKQLGNPEADALLAEIERRGLDA